MDLRFAFRTFRRNPGPIVLAILAVALGVGANTAIFSVVRSVLLRPLPYLEPDRLVLIGDSNPAAGTFNEGNSSANFLDWRDQNQVFASMAAFADWVPGAKSIALRSHRGDPLRLMPSVSDDRVPRVAVSHE